ncbi:MAG: hypothetical protein JJE37_02775 [Methyloceanibacter sp.]|jgi:hypothetical protein|nr:hypothetical protein [Methyloceanibacter sp.]
MRQSPILMTAFMAGGMFLGLAASHANAGPLPAVAALDAAPSAIVKVDYWRRYYRNHGYGPDTVIVAPPVIVQESPPVVLEVPVRPVSCGQYRYWDGDHCVDARYNNPYIGPR